MEITVKCNKLFIQDLPAGGSSLFFKQNTSYHRNVFLRLMIFLVSISTTNPVFQLCSLAGFVLDPSKWWRPEHIPGSGAPPTPPGRWERSPPNSKQARRTRHPGRDGLGGLGGMGFCSWRVGLFSPPHPGCADTL